MKTHEFKAHLAGIQKNVKKVGCCKNANLRAHLAYFQGQLSGSRECNPLSEKQKSHVEGMIAMIEMTFDLDDFVRDEEINALTGNNV